MTPRIKYIIAGAVGAALALFSIVVFAVNYSFYVDRNNRMFDVPPSEEALKELEARGVGKGEIAVFMDSVNRTHKYHEGVNGFLHQCDDLFKAGNMSHRVFIGCSTFVWSYANHLGQLINETQGPLGVISSTL